MSVSEPDRVLEAGVVVPSRRVHSDCGVAVEIVIRAAEAPALTSARYSRLPAASILLVASTVRVARRTIVAPVESTGCEARRPPSTRSRSPIGWPTTSNDDPVPIGPLPMRSSLCHADTCVGKRSCRASLSPPRPTIPNSSP